MGFIAVSIKPGITTLTPIGASIDASSARSTSDTASTPCLATAYGPSWAGVYTAAMDAVLTTWPSSPEARMSGTNERMPWITPQRSTSITRCQSVQRQLPRVPRCDDAGVVHGNVELSEPIDGGPTDSLDGIGVTDISGHPIHVRATVGETRDVRLESLHVHVGHDHAHALGDEGLDDREADAARGAGDDGTSALELFHDSTLRDVNEEDVGEVPSSVLELRKSGLCLSWCSPGT